MTDLSSAIFGDGRAKGQNRRTLFDRMLPHESINLKIGAPGSVILKRSAEAIKKATTHRMVRGRMALSRVVSAQIHLWCEVLGDTL